MFTWCICLFNKLHRKIVPAVRGGFRGGRGTPPSQGFDPCRPKGSPLCTILKYPILVTDPKIFLREPSILILKGECAPKKRNFLVKFFQKVPKNAKTGTKPCLGRARKINSVNLKKGRQNFSKSTPHPLDPPLRKNYKSLRCTNVRGRKFFEKKNR